MPENFLLHVTLLGSTSPLIFRTLSVPWHSTFESLHLAIQRSMGWKNKHLWRITFQSNAPTPGKLYLSSRPLLRIEDHRMEGFVKYDEGYGRSIAASPGGPREERDSHGIKVGEVLGEGGVGKWFGKGVEITYEYDWIDRWTHKIELVGRVAETRNFQCVAGKGHEAAESGGGILGWEEIKLAYLTMDAHLTPDQRRLREWYETDCINGGISPSFGFRAKDWKRSIVNGRLERIRLDA